MQVPNGASAAAPYSAGVEFVGKIPAVSVQKQTFGSKLYGREDDINTFYFGEDGIGKWSSPAAGYLLFLALNAIEL